MATDLRGYSADEVLNKVLNISNDSIQVDIVSGSEYAEDSQHTDLDTGQFVLGVRNDALAALGGTDGDYVPFQMNASGALYVEIASGGSANAVYVDDADWSDGSSSHMLVGGLYQSSPQSITDGDVGPFQVDANGRLGVALSPTDNAVLDAMVVDLAAIEALIITLDGVQDNALTKLGEIETTNNANQVLLGTIDSDTDAIKTAVQILDNAISGSEMQVDVVAALPAGSNTIGVVDLGSTDNAVLDAIDAVLDTIKTDTGTIDADTDAIKTATESSNTHLGNMFYDTALAVTPSDGSDLSGEPFFAVYVGTGGNLKVDMADGGAAVTLSNVASGQLLPIMVERIYATGTTASNIIAFK